MAAMLERFRRLVLIALASGVLAGSAVMLVQHEFVVPMIRVAELGEAAATAASTGHDPALAEVAPSLAMTWTANVLNGIGFGLLLIVTMTIRGGGLGWRQALGWAAAGFACFALAPALGLPPALPGAPEAPLGDRQLWWIATCGLSAIGLLALIDADRVLMKAAGVVLIVLPHAIGAPATGPADTSFVLAALGSLAVFWAVLAGATVALAARLPVEKRPLGRDQAATSSI